MYNVQVVATTTGSHEVSVIIGPVHTLLRCPLWNGGHVCLIWCHFDRKTILDIFLQNFRLKKCMFAGVHMCICGFLMNWNGKFCQVLTRSRRFADPKLTLVEFAHDASL
jgi:hypothetical protein